MVNATDEAKTSGRWNGATGNWYNPSPFMMTEIDILSAALCAWKENRGGGMQGMKSVICVLLNRSAESKQSVYAEVYRPFQFSSMTYHNDPQLLKQPASDDPEWAAARSLAIAASNTGFDDITNGATFYYAQSMDANPPSWAAKMTPTAFIAGQRFFKA